MTETGACTKGWAAHSSGVSIGVLTGGIRSSKKQVFHNTLEIVSNNHPSSNGQDCPFVSSED